MLLGDLLAQFDDETVAVETIMNLADIGLVASVKEQAAANGQSLGVYAAGAVRRFVNESSDEAWIALMGALSRTEDPGKVFFERALRASIDPKAPVIAATQYG